MTTNNNTTPQTGTTKPRDLEILEQIEQGLAMLTEEELHNVLVHFYAMAGPQDRRIMTGLLTDPASLKSELLTGSFTPEVLQ